MKNGKWKKRRGRGGRGGEEERGKATSRLGREMDAPVCYLGDWSKSCQMVCTKSRYSLTGQYVFGFKHPPT